MTVKDGKLIIDNENKEYPFLLKMEKVDSFTEYDFNAVSENIPDENILLEPETEATT